MQRSFASTALVLAGLVSAGCTPDVTLGTPCDLASECESPLVCRHERCRTACRVNRDCGDGFECRLDESGTGSCALAVDRCTDAACPEGLVCFSGACFAPCAQDDQCPEDGYCAPAAGGICASRSEHETDAGAPSDAGVSRPERRACGPGAECPEGAVCASLFDGLLVCRRACTDSSECANGFGSSLCVLAQTLDGSDVAACSIPCDPLDDAACVGGETCDGWSERAVADGSYQNVLDCRPVRGSAGVGGSCDSGGSTDERLCAAGLTCHGPTRTCVSQCAMTPSGPTTCPAGTRCVIEAPALRYGLTSFGSCLPDAG